MGRCEYCDQELEYVEWQGKPYLVHTGSKLAGCYPTTQAKIKGSPDKPKPKFTR